MAKPDLARAADGVHANLATDSDCVITYTAAVDLPAEVKPLRLGVHSVADLARAAKVPDGSFQTIADSWIFSNGWQSWSAGWEVGPGERVERAILIDKLNIYTDRPFCVPRRGEIVSHFLTWFRSGNRFLALVSMQTNGAPVGFRIKRKANTVAVDAYAIGKAYGSGEVIARVRVLAADSFFALRDTIRAAFAPFGLFDRLSFLSSNGRLVPGGYESWYNHYADIDERLILDDLDHIGTSDNLVNAYYIRRGKPTVFQVDDGWERAVGDWRVDERRFPRGMDIIARAIDDKGLIPGLWLAPFLVTKKAALYSERPDWLLKDARGRPVVAGWMQNWGGDFFCLDISRADVLDYLDDLVRRVVDDWGYRYIKLDFLYAGALPGAHAEGGAPFELYGRALDRITRLRSDAAGRPVAFLGCGAPLESSYRALPLMRVGADTREAWEHPQGRLLRHQGRPSAYVNLKSTIGRAVLNEAVFINDPDVVFCRNSNISLTEREKELIALINFLFASQIMFSDDATRFNPATEGPFTDRIVALYDRLRNVECCALRVAGARDVYRVESRDGSVHGVVNLGNRYAVVDGSWEPKRAIVYNARAIDGNVAFAPRSISLFESA